MKVIFNDVPRMKIANGGGTIARYPDGCSHFITIDLLDVDQDRTIGCIDFDVEDAIELRNWLNAAIPQQSQTEVIQK